MSKQTEGKSAKITPAKPELLFPMRINKYLALKNYSTRRGADDIITSKKVFINGKLAVLGDKVNETDSVEVKYRGKTAPKFAYFAFNKPKGMNTGAQDKGAERHLVGSTLRTKGAKANTYASGTPEVEGKPITMDIVKSLPKELQTLKLFPVGRLDKDSHGLIVLTNDGRVTDRLLNPKYEHDKEYEVTTVRPLRGNFKEKIEGGLNIEGYITKPAQAKKLSDNKFSVTLTEGKTHQVRRMVSALFNEVKDLKRTRIMNIRLGSLKSGTARALEGKELSDFLAGLEL